MERQRITTDSYYIYAHNKILKISPIVGLIAALTFTVARLLGAFSETTITSLICFDAICLTYFFVAHILKKNYGILKNGRISDHSIWVTNLILDFLIILQWNLISYIFPARALWGFAPMFVLLSAFFFNFKAVLITISGISLSIAVSWILQGDKLLPAQGDMYLENLTLEIVALVISFTVIAILTRFSENFATKVKDNYNALEDKNDQLVQTGRDVMDFTADLIEERDSTSGSHVKRLKAFTKIFAEQVAKIYPEYDLHDEQIEQITNACVLHDVGKIGIPDSILLKPGKLTPEEFETIKTHTVLGAKIVDKLPDSLGADFKKICREICLYHHEKYDGRGYPEGLKGDEIPIAAQIVSVVDCYDALTNERPYKAAFSPDKAVDMILNGECGTFSEPMKKCLMACKPDFKKI